MDAQLAASIVPMDPKETFSRRMKVIKGVTGFVVLAGIVLGAVLLFVDSRPAEPGVEGPMIDEFNSIPSGMSKEQWKDLSW